MTVFTAWKFDTPDGAATAAEHIAQAVTAGRLCVIDQVVVTWPQARERATVTHRHHGRVPGAAWGAFWGLLLGGTLLGPVWAIGAGAAIGALGRGDTSVGLAMDELETLRTQVVPGTSALLLVSEGGDVELAATLLDGLGVALVRTDLADEDCDRLLAELRR